MFEEYLSEDENYVLIEEKENSSVKYRQSYSEESVSTALEEIFEGSSLYAASKKFTIPESTLRSRLKNTNEGRNAGRKTVLDAETESLIADWVIQYAEMGDPRTREDLNEAAAELSKLNKDPKQRFDTIDGKPTKRWTEGFLKRHPQLSLRTPESISRASANVSEQDIRRFFHHFSSWLEKQSFNHLKELPANWINSDETGFPLNPVPSKVLAQKGAKNVYRVEPSKPKERVTVTYTLGADGHCYQPQLIFKKSLSCITDIAFALGGKYFILNCLFFDFCLINSIFIECDANYNISQTENGWQTQESFADYDKSKLVAEIDKRQVKRTADTPVLYFLDGHRSHINFSLFKWCRENFIVIITFFPNATHILQMCDVSMFGPAKQTFTKEVQKWKSASGNRDLDEIQFVKILKRVNDLVMLPEKIINGFKATGIYPLNVENVHLERCIGGKSSSSSAEVPEINIDQVSDSNVQDLFQEIQERTAKLRKIFKTSQPFQLRNIDIIDQQLKIIDQQVSITDNSSHPFNNFINEETETHNISLPSVSNVLKPPEPYIRRKRRVYKTANYGVMTSDEIMQDYEKNEIEKAESEKIKADRKQARELKKAENLKILKIKKEKNVPKSKTPRIETPLFENKKYATRKSYKNSSI